MRNRRGADLFQVLGQRLRPSSERGDDKRPASSRGQPDDGPGVWETVRGDAAQLWSSVRSRFGGGSAEPSSRGGKAKKPGKGAASGRRNAAPAAVPLTPGILMAVLAIGLSVGFVVGRIVPRAAAAAELSSRAGPSVRQPEVLDDRGAGGLPASELEKPLSKFVYPVLPFSASQSAQARRLVDHLVGNGFETTRLSRITYQGREYLMVVVYVEQNDTHTLSELIALDAPGFEPRWESKTIPNLQSNQKPRAWPPTGT